MTNSTESPRVTAASEWTGRHWRSGESVTVRAENGLISSIEPATIEAAANQSATPAIDGDEWVAPGLIDAQVNGAAGFDLNRGDGSPENVIGTVYALYRDGVTRICPTVSTASTEHIMAGVRAIDDACAHDPLVDHTVLGIHVEGPFISREDGPRGVHDPQAVRDPDFDEFLRWQEAAHGRIRMVTVAPELPGAIEFIAMLRDAGVIAAIGHTAASEDEVARAVEAGATMSTHLGNGAHPVLPRHPNYLWAQLADDRLWAGLIADGFHLPASTLSVMLRTKGRKAVLVSDVGYLAHSSPGRYSGHHHTDVVLEQSGRLHIADSPQLLAGSASTLRAGVENVARRGILSLPEAIDCATSHPARMLGTTDGTGELAVGAPADLMMYRWDGSSLAVTATVCSGQEVFHA